MKTICVHSLVKNEERFIWYSVMSVIEHVDKILLWDTGSADNTLEIVKKLQEKYPNKIAFKEVKNVNPKQFSEIRQKMLDESDSDWIMVLDGDEIWPEDSIKCLVDTINGDKFDVIVVPFVNFVGDIFHYQEKLAGRYSIDGKIGNYSIKAFKKNIKGLQVNNDYGSEGYVDLNGEFLQKSSLVKRGFITNPFFHATHLKRSVKDNVTMGRSGKIKHEIGIPFPGDYYYPEVFFGSKPVIVESPWVQMPVPFKVVSFFMTPLRKIKRRFI